MIGSLENIKLLGNMWGLCTRDMNLRYWLFLNPLILGDQNKAEKRVFRSRLENLGDEEVEYLRTW